MCNESIEELSACIRARDAAIWIRSVEERRIEQIVAAVAKQLDIGMQLWSCATGFTFIGGDSGENVNDPLDALGKAMQWSSSCIFVMRDFHYYMDPGLPPNVPIIRALRDIARAAKEQPDDTRKIFIFTSPTVKLPEDLQEEVYVMNWPLPSRAEIAEAVNGVLDQRKDIAEKLDDAGRESVIEAARGLTMAEAENVFARSIAKTGSLDVASIVLGKKAAVERDGTIEWMDTDIELSDIGGLECVKEWAISRRETFSIEAREFGIKAPKSTLLHGVPGCGKSLAAKALAKAWGMVLLRLDMASLKGSLVGESTANLQKALRTAVASAPCCLLLDEVEKSMAGSTGASAGLDSGVGSEMLGVLLTFMQENTAPVFLAMTSNDMSALPPELTRRGRADEVWFVDLPHIEERKAIWTVHLKKVKRNPDKYGIVRLADSSGGFSGAEIEACVQDALVDAFAAREELMPKHLLAVIERTEPMSQTAADKIKEIRSGAKGRARNASRPPEPVSSSGASSSRFAQMKS